MSLANGIRKHGFRNWHERELLTSHGWLVLVLLLGVVAFAGFESLLKSEGWRLQSINILIILAAGLGVMFSLQRFLSRLVRAQRAASQATCPQCETFGRLQVVAEDREATWVRVRCRECGHEWAMDDD